MIKLNTVIHGDCLDVMRDIPDNYVDLILTDPPYGINWKSVRATGVVDKGLPTERIINTKNKYKDKNWDESAPEKEYFEEIFRVSRNQIIFGGNYFKLPISNGWIFWDKKTYCNNYSDGELAWTSFKRNLKKIEIPWSGFYVAHSSEEKQHPTQKPVELMVWCLENYLLKNWKEDRRPRVFDGFAGSGTTGVACKKCGCDYLLVEQDSDYVEICNKRLRQETLF